MSVFTEDEIGGGTDDEDDEEDGPQPEVTHTTGVCARTGAAHPHLQGPGRARLCRENEGARPVGPAAVMNDGHGAIEVHWGWGKRKERRGDGVRGRERERGERVEVMERGER